MFFRSVKINLDPLHGLKSDELNLFGLHKQSKHRLVNNKQSAEGETDHWLMMSNQKGSKVNV